MKAPRAGVLLDTSVLSELTRPRPHAGVLRYLDTLEATGSFLSLITVGEIERGIAQVQPTTPQRALKLRTWLEGTVLPAYAGRILPLDENTVRRWGELMARPEVRARSGLAVDGFIAASAAVHHLTVVTRNVADFRVFPVTVFNPYDDLSVT